MAQTSEPVQPIAAAKVTDPAKVELGKKLTADKPGLKVIYSSGYSPDAVQEGVAFVEGVNYLAKPYDARTLITMVNKLFPAERSPVGRPPSEVATGVSQAALELALSDIS